MFALFEFSGSNNQAAQFGSPPLPLAFPPPHGALFSTLPERSFFHPLPIKKVLCLMFRSYCFPPRQAGSPSRPPSFSRTSVESPPSPREPSPKFTITVLTPLDAERSPPRIERRVRRAPPLFQGPNRRKAVSFPLTEDFLLLP